MRTKTDRIWLDGVMGVVTGDALGCPVQFRSREEVEKKPVAGMEGYGTFHLPPGSWTDDSSLTLATLDSIRTAIRKEGHYGIDLNDMMQRFVWWLERGSYTPFGQSFDIGSGTRQAIERYIRNPNTDLCGGREANNNGNGSLMRILPVCLYGTRIQRNPGGLSDGLTEGEVISIIHLVSGLTHAHMRTKIACGLYYFMVRQILWDDGPLIDRLQHGIDAGFAFYRQDVSTLAELSNYGRLHDLYAFAKCPAAEIRSSGYVVDTLEAAVWSLLKTKSFRDALLLAVNLGEDSDTVGAVCGGLAGLFYGYESIPADWLAAIQRRAWVESLCVEVLI